MKLCGFEVGLTQPLFLIAGPCVVESEQLQLATAGTLKEITGGLAEVKRQIGVPVRTDVHEYTPMNEVAAVVDVLQTPAFLARQTDFIQNVARAGKPVNIKKGQFLAPWDMKHVVAKARDVGNDDIMVCERGASFGYNNLVSDMRSLSVMRETR